jgi:hypothetical protein
VLGANFLGSREGKWVLGGKFRFLLVWCVRNINKSSKKISNCIFIGLTLGLNDPIL